MKDEYLTKQNETDKRPALIKEMKTSRECKLISPGGLPQKMKRSRRC